MSQQSTTQLPAKADPLPMKPFAEDWLNLLRKGVGSTLSGNTHKPTLPVGLSVSELQVTQITGWMNKLASKLAAGDRRAWREGAAVEIQKLVSAFRMQDKDAVSARLAGEAYLEGIADEPVWAIAEARKLIIAGKVASINPAFAPNPPEFAIVVRQVSAPMRADLRDLARISEAVAREKEASAEEREFINQGFEDAKASLGHPPRGYATVSARMQLEAMCEKNGIPLSEIDKLDDQPGPRGQIGQSLPPTPTRS